MALTHALAWWYGNHRIGCGYFTSFGYWWCSVVFSRSNSSWGRQIAPTNQPHCKKTLVYLCGLYSPGSLDVSLGRYVCFRCHKSLDEYDGIWWVLNQKRKLGILEQQSDDPVYCYLIYVFGRNEFCPYLFWIKREIRTNLARQ